MSKNKRFVSYFFTVILIFTAVSCSDNFINSTNITSNPVRFFQMVKSVGNDNEILIALKEKDAPRISKTRLEQFPDSKIALPKTDPSAPRRTRPGFPPVDLESRQSIRALLEDHDVSRFKAPDSGNVFTAHLPKKNAINLIAALLQSPYIDYMEANQARQFHF